MQTGEKLWSIWMRSKMAARADSFFGVHEQKSPDGEVVLKMWWAGRIAIGWHRELKPDLPPTE